MVARAASKFPRADAGVDGHSEISLSSIESSANVRLSHVPVSHIPGTFFFLSMPIMKLPDRIPSVHLCVYAVP